MSRCASLYLVFYLSLILPTLVQAQSSGHDTFTTVSSKTSLNTATSFTVSSTAFSTSITTAAINTIFSSTPTITFASSGLASNSSSAAPTSTSLPLDDDVVEDPDYPLPDDSPSAPPESYTNNSIPSQRKNHGNQKPVILNTTEAIQLANMEGDFYTYFAENEPAPGAASIVIHNATCPGVGSKLLRRAQTNCETYKQININIYFHYIWDGIAARKTRKEWESRVQLEMSFLKSVYDPLGIIFTYVPSIEYLKGNFSHNIMENTIGHDIVLNKFHKGGRDDLNVFMVESIRSIADYDSTLQYNGYTNILSSTNLNGDGVIMDQARLGNEAQNTLVHEAGHWLGLEHTFGVIGSLCTLDDGLLDTTRTSGALDTVFECFQIPCDINETERIENWMSYSACAGEDPNGSIAKTGFTTDQKARMFARFLKYRRNVTNACVQDPTVNILRGLNRRVDGTVPSMQNLKDGTCPVPGAPIPGTVYASAIGPENLSPNGQATAGGSATAMGTQAPTSVTTAGSASTKATTSAASLNASKWSLTAASVFVALSCVLILP